MTEFRVGSCFGRFELLAELGIGGMGRVFKARDPMVDRDVALKLLLGHGLDRELLIRGVMREGKILARLNHRNIVHLYEASVFEGTPYFAMELVVGCTLRRACSSFGATMEVFDTLGISVQIGEALCVAHGAGIVHNDLKPENIMLTSPHCFVKLVDFGLSRNIDRASTGTTAELVDGRGTPHYMAPELHRGERSTEKSDVYAWGQITHEMLTDLFLFGQSMEDVPSRREVGRLHLTAAPAGIVPVRGSLLAGVEQIVLRMVAKDPEARPTANEARRELQAEMVRLLVEAPGISERTLTAGASGPVIVQVPAAMPSDRVETPGRATLPQGTVRAEHASEVITLPSGRTLAPISVPATTSSAEAQDSPRVSHRMRAFLTSPMGSAAETSVAPSESISLLSAPPRPPPREPAVPSSPARSETGEVDVSFASTEPLAATGALDSGKFATPPPMMRSTASRAPVFATERQRAQRRSWWTGLVIGLASAFVMFAVWLVRADLVAHLTASPGDGAPPAEPAPPSREAPISDIPEDAAGAPVDPAWDAGSAGAGSDAGPEPVAAGGPPARNAGRTPQLAAKLPPKADKPAKAPKPPSAPPGQRICDLLAGGCSSADACEDPWLASSPSCNHAPHSTLPPDHPLLKKRAQAAPAAASASPTAPQKTMSKLPSNAAPKSLAPVPPSGAAPKP